MNSIKFVLLNFACCLLCFGLFLLTPTYGEPNKGCEVLIYSSITLPPVKRQDYKGTCPPGGGPRAFVLNTEPALQHQHHYGGPAGGEARLKPQLKEVAPESDQDFRCLSEQKCYLVIRGFNVGLLDAIAILPVGQSTCPPSTASSSTATEAASSTATDAASSTATETASSTATETATVRADVSHDSVNNQDMTVIVQSENSATLTGSEQRNKATFAVFELPDRFSMSKSGLHTLCYAPVLSVEAKTIDDYLPIHFHYNAGHLSIGESLIDCNFESTKAKIQDQGDLAEADLPCGFKNIRDRWEANLVWQIGTGETETSGTGPKTDSTPGYTNGHYLYMDSPGYALGAPATVVSPPIAFPAGVFCVQFSYSMYGVDVSTLRAYIHEVKLNSLVRPNYDSPVVSVAAAPADVEETLMGNWGSPKWVAVGNKGEKWHIAGFEFKSTAMQTFQLVFEALAGKSEYGDIAIDDVSIKSGRCPAEIRNHMPKTLGHANQSLVCGEVRLITGSNSADKLWYVENAVSCSGRGYSLDNLNSTGWLPCCVPHLGTYKLVLEDLFGDGWTGSYLEFMFFDRVMKFGDKEFQHEGFDSTFNLIIGSLEIVKINKFADLRVVVDVRVARQNSYVWCGVVQAGIEGKPLKVNLTSELVKKFGVRAEAPSKRNNDVVSVELKHVLKKDELYDLYCHSEVAGDIEKLSTEQINREIANSRTRFSTDVEPPQIYDIDVVPSFHSITVSFTVAESAGIWCLAVKHKTSEIESDPLFGPTGALETVSDSPEDLDRMARYFVAEGDPVNISIETVNDKKPVKGEITISSLIPNTRYSVYCFAEDSALPVPNRMSVAAVRATIRSVQTEAKVPTVKINRKQTLHRGFRLFVSSDAPGVAYCAAAAVDYGVPEVEEVAKVGAKTNVTEPGKTYAVEVRGVDPNTPYTIYCIGGRQTDEGYFEYSEYSEMVKNAAPVVSYGKYCEEDGANVKIVTTADAFTPFHPVTAEEEVRIRNYVMGQPELGFEGVYRITLLANKTEIKNFYLGRSAKPLRFARVRGGRCVNNVGIYEQLKVGPLDSGAPLSYERIAKPVETDCGGYNPTGVFGRRLFEANDGWQGNYRDRFNRWLKNSFGFEFGTPKCVDSARASPRVYGTALHLHDSKCLQLGPVGIEEICGNNDALDVPCTTGDRAGRVWVGMKTALGEQLPLYFVYALPAVEASSGSSNPTSNETADEWIRRIIRNKSLPEDFHEIWEASEFWFEGQTFKSIGLFLDAVSKGEVARTSPRLFQSRRKLKEEQLFSEGRRQLEPQPYPGAAGTAGPLPSRVKRREGLEYRAHPEHVESQGKRFQIEASADDEEFLITYGGWKMIATNDRDTGMRIYNVTFKEQSVAFEMGVMECLAHYSVSERNWFFLDSWYGGLGAAARKVFKGVECPKTAVSLFWDGSLCVFEQDMARPTRSHWKAGQIRDGAPHTSLVLRQMVTVSNYDYVTDYRFHLTGIFEGGISFTGELYAGIEVPWYSARQSNYGTQVTGAMRFAALHSHMAVWKVDLDVGVEDNWKTNSIYLTEVVPDEARPGANKLIRAFAQTERDGIYFRNDTRALVYEVIDENKKVFGNYGGWRVIAFPGINPLHHDFELYSGPAAWAKYRLFSTVHKYSEMDSTLPRDNKYASRPATSVDRYLLDNEPIRNADIVTWISDGIFHLPVIEDMPYTVPIGNQLGWMIKPSNLFLEDPSMDLWNSMSGGVKDPGTCAVMRLSAGEVEPEFENVWALPDTGFRTRAAAPRNQRVN